MNIYIKHLYNQSMEVFFYGKKRSEEYNSLFRSGYSLFFI